MSEEPLIKADSVSKTFAGSVPVSVLKNVTFELKRSETVAIMGKSGEGKNDAAAHTRHPRHPNDRSG